MPPEDDKTKPGGKGKPTSEEIRAILKEHGVDWDPLKDTKVTHKLDNLYSEIAMQKQKLEEATDLIAKMQPIVDAKKAEDDKNKTEIQKLTEELNDLKGKLSDADTELKGYRKAEKDREVKAKAKFDEIYGNLNEDDQGLIHESLGIYEKLEIAEKLAARTQKPNPKPSGGKLPPGGTGGPPEIPKIPLNDEDDRKRRIMGLTKAQYAAWVKGPELVKAGKMKQEEVDKVAKTLDTTSKEPIKPPEEEEEGEQ